MVTLAEQEYQYHSKDKASLWHETWHRNSYSGLPVEGLSFLWRKKPHLREGKVAWLQDTRVQALYAKGTLEGHSGYNNLFYL